jgi:uncharacterized protein (TIGR02594 family)
MMIEPHWLKIARQYEGVTEIQGPATNKTIASWIKKLGAWWSGDAVPWCGLFVAAVMLEAKLPYPVLYPQAKAWANYGSRLRPEVLAPGAILVFGRKGGGHVGFYLGEDDTHYHVFGGNQKNAVNVMRLEKGRLIASRWPKGEAVLGGPVKLAANGMISHNEG